MTAENSRWKRADADDEFLYCPDHANKFIFYAREYTSHGSYSCSDTNQKVSNLKISPTQTHRLAYKRDAMECFATEAASFFDRALIEGKFGILVPMPPSKSSDNPEYDDRMMQVSKKVLIKCPGKIAVKELLKRSTSRDARHKTGHDRSHTEELKTLGLSEWANSYTPNANDIIIVFDDVTTGGGSFEAARILLSQRYPDTKVVGVMWAKAKAMTLPPGWANF